MNKQKIAILHYSASPVIGGVEAVMDAHIKLLINHGHHVTVIAGRGEKNALPDGTELVRIPLIDSMHPEIIEINKILEQGKVPKLFEPIQQELINLLKPILVKFDTVIIHNIFTKHFNLPLTAALFSLLDDKNIANCIAWSHDFTWTSPNSRLKVFAGYPWDYLRAYREDIQYVVVSQARQKELANLFSVDPQTINVVYNGVDPDHLLGLSKQTRKIIDQCDLVNSQLNILMPVRVTQAKNIEFALHTLEALQAEGYKPKLILTGPPDPHDEKSLHYFEQLKKLRDQLGLKGMMFFVYELKTSDGLPLTISMNVVGELFRIADILFMPSHREGFGMPILEAGLHGLGIFSAPIPAAVEIGNQHIHLIDLNLPAIVTAKQIMQWCKTNPQYKMRKKIRTQFTWEAIYKKDIAPLIIEKENQK